MTDRSWSDSLVMKDKSLSSDLAREMRTVLFDCFSTILPWFKIRILNHGSFWIFQRNIPLFFVFYMESNKANKTNRRSLISVVFSVLSHGYDQWCVSNWGWIKRAISKPTPTLQLLFCQKRRNATALPNTDFKKAFQNGPWSLQLSSSRHSSVHLLLWVRIHGHLPVRGCPVFAELRTLEDPLRAVCPGCLCGLPGSGCCGVWSQPGWVPSFFPSPNLWLLDTFPHSDFAVLQSPWGMRCLTLLNSWRLSCWDHLTPRSIFSTG